VSWKEERDSASAGSMRLSTLILRVSQRAGRGGKVFPEEKAGPGEMMKKRPVIFGWGRGVSSNDAKIGSGPWLKRSGRKIENRAERVGMGAEEARCGVGKGESIVRL